MKSDRKIDELTKDRYIRFKGLEFNNKTEIVRLSEFSKISKLDIIGFNIKANHDKKFDIIVGKSKLTQYKQSEKKFSDFGGMQYQKIHKLIPNEDLSLRQ